MKLYGTPKSHFTRKVRLVLDHLELDYALVDVGNVAKMDIDLFADNPTMAVPVLMDGELKLFDSDHIAAYLVRKFDPDDRFHVLTTDPGLLNARAILNGAMSAEVRLVMGGRHGFETNGNPFFDKPRKVIAQTFDWCEENQNLFNPSDPKFLDFHFISLWDHVHFFGLADGTWTDLDQLAEQLRLHEKISKSDIPAG